MSTMNGPAGKCAVWARVSTAEQETENQLHELREWAARLGLEVAAEFILEDSAWANGNGNGKGAEFDAKRAELIDGARMKHYQTTLAWGLDRLSRRGTEDMFAFLRQLTATGCALRCRQDPWVESVTDPFARELLVGIFATVARFESQRRSERIRAGMARRKREGLPVGGRKKGSKDKRPRARKTGEAAGWTAERKAAVQKITPEQVARARQLRADGLSYQKIADALSEDGEPVATSTVYQTLKRPAA